MAGSLGWSIGRRACSKQSPGCSLTSNFRPDGKQAYFAPGRLSKSGSAVRSWAGTMLSSRSKEVDMRVMVLVKATKDSEAGVLPTMEMLTAMGRFNEALAKAG